MFLAYYNFACPPIDFTRNYFDAIEKSLSNTEAKIKPEERIHFFIDKLISGDIGKTRFLIYFIYFKKNADLLKKRALTC